MLSQEQLAAVVLPVGRLTKREVRARASALGLRTAAKPDSQDTCFITATGRRAAFLADRVGLHRGRVLDAESGLEIGSVDSVELVTIGQRRGLGGGSASPRYAVDVDTASSTVTVGPMRALLRERVTVAGAVWIDRRPRPGTPVVVQTSAHGRAVEGTWEVDSVRFTVPQRRVAPGQSVVLYDAPTGNEVLGGGPAV
jgi:tRNA-specific 2-thiouridylase